MTKTTIAASALLLITLAGCHGPEHNKTNTEASSVQTVTPSAGPTKTPTPKPTKTSAPVEEKVEPAPAPVVEPVVPATPVEPAPPVVVETPAPVALAAPVAPVQAPKTVTPTPVPPPAPKPVQAAPAPSSGGYNWAGLAQCESGGDPTAVSPGGLYHGLYQFSPQTWASVGGTGLPSQASPAEQLKRAKILASKATPASQWPVCSANM